MRARSSAFLATLKRRRTVRGYSTEAVPMDVVERAIEAAASAPSGANQQPWTFVIVTDVELKRRIRGAAEEEERRSYGGRMSAEWLAALEPLGTDEHKPHLEDAPVVIVVFEQAYGLGPDGRKLKHYYVRESVGIAVGFLLAALNDAGLATLTHTPSPMAFLREVPRERACVRGDPGRLSGERRDGAGDPEEVPRRGARQALGDGVGASGSGSRASIRSSKRRRISSPVANRS